MSCSVLLQLWQRWLPLLLLLAGSTTTFAEDQPLCTYFVSATTPLLTVEPEGARAGTTRLLVRLQQGLINQHMPVITASIDPGVVHDVVNTWDWLQMYAAAHAEAAAVGARRFSWRAQMYPLPGVTFKGASALAAPDAVPSDIKDIIAAERELGLRWTWLAAPSALLLLPGQAVAAVADVQDVTADGEEVVLTLDVVHEPFTFSEFKPHGVQQQDSRAHYHFHTPAGVTTDAAKFLEDLAQHQDGPAGKPPGLFIFFKGLPDQQWHWHLQPEQGSAETATE